MEFIRCDLPILSYIRLRPYGALVVPCGGPRGTTGAIKTYLRCHRTPPECERTAVSGAERTPLGPAAAISPTESAPGSSAGKSSGGVQEALHGSDAVDTAGLVDQLPDLVRSFHL